MKKNILKMLKSKKVMKEDTPAEAIMREFVKGWIGDSVLQKSTETKEDATKRKKAERKAILKGDLVVGAGAETIFKEKTKSALLSAQLKKLEPFKPFRKTDQEQKENAKRGGHAKLSAGYSKFVEWVDKTGFDVKSHANNSNQNFANALLTFKCNGIITPMKLAPKTADKYRKIFLSESK